MEENKGSPKFADRYHFQQVGKNWDRGLTGYTHLVFDTKEEHLGVIKRAELNSQEAVEGLKNEVAALLDLKAKGLGVPEVYDTGETEYGSKKYYYIVIEYIEGMRVENDLSSLLPVERAEIITQLFGLLAGAHKIGIVNRDVDLKHLFWRREKRQLIMIDWGSSKLDVDPKKKHEFSYDLARCAEVLYWLVTRKGHPSATGSLALPKDSALIVGLPPLPVAFYNLCKWAPRTPEDKLQAPYTAQELQDISRAWQKGVPYKPVRKMNWVWSLFFAAIIPVLAYLGLSPQSPLHNIIYGSTPITPTALEIVRTQTAELATQTEVPTTSPTETEGPVDTPTLTVTVTVPPTDTVAAPITPVGRGYTRNLLSLDSQLGEAQCAINNDDVNVRNGLGPFEAVTKRPDSNWQFKVEDGRTPDQYIRSNFSACVDMSQVDAVALNTSILRLELERKLADSNSIEDGKQFGIFLENAGGHRREYTVWITLDKKMHLRVRDGEDVVFDDTIFIVNEKNIKIEGTYPRLYAVFPIQFFLELNNEGLDIVYLKEGLMQIGVDPGNINPSNQMILIDKAVLPAFGDITKIGLVGYGGETQALIWPLVFWGE